MIKFLRRTLSSLPSPIDELPSSAIFGLDRVRMILTNATELNNADEIKEIDWPSARGDRASI
jgi:hypothetical protein